MHQLLIAKPTDQRDEWVTRALLGLAVLLIVSSYLFRSLNPNGVYEDSVANERIPTIVNTEAGTSTTQ